MTNLKPYIIKDSINIHTMIKPIRLYYKTIEQRLHTIHRIKIKQLYKL
jgi:hypothetical protein